MKIVVSYINSIYDISKTIKKIDLSIADGIHVDLMDGMYVANNNLDVSLLPELFKGISKPLDIHLMVLKPSKYLDILYKLIPDCIYIHPETEQDPITVIKNIKEHCHVGIVINPNQNIEGFKDYLKYINRVLLMSVIPGKGGQKFIENTKDKLAELKKYQEKYNFEIYIDGGINAETIKEVKGADGVVSGSFVCQNEDFDKQIALLKLSR